MLTQVCRLVCGEVESQGTQRVTPFEVRYSNVAVHVSGSLRWQPVDTERFQLIANETVKVGQPVNRDDALYWIEQVRARALGEGEVVGWIKVN